MANKVFANGRELACKSGAGKVISAFPDVCFTPPDKVPPTPPGVPIPYPVTSMAGDTDKGTKKVVVGGKEVMHRDASNFKKCNGDNAAQTAKKGMINSKLSGKVRFTSWSMDVKIEGDNAVRHLDTTNSNYGSSANAPLPWPFIDKAAAAQKRKCAKDKKKEKEACKDYKPNKGKTKDVCQKAEVHKGFSYSKSVASRRSRKASEDPCMAARKCRLVPFNATPKDGFNGCCPGQTADHIIPKSSFYKTRFGIGMLKGWKYEQKSAPCMCLVGGSNSGSHGLRHAHHKSFRSKSMQKKPVSFKDEASYCAKGAAAVAPGCSKACIEAQLKEGHKSMTKPKTDPLPDVKFSPTGGNYIGKTAALLQKIKLAIPSLGSSVP